MFLPSRRRLQTLWHRGPDGATGASFARASMCNGAVKVGFCFASWRPRRYPFWRFVEGAMSKTDEQSKADGPRIGPKPMRAPQRRVTEPVEQLDAPKQPARAVGAQ